METQIDIRDEYEFSVDWFSGHIPTWDRIFEVIHPEKILEIGSYEGRSTCYLIETCTKTNPIAMFCVDSWLGSVEHDPEEMSRVEQRFDRNIVRVLAKSGNACQLHKLKGVSSSIAPALISSGHAESFDFIYIDGSHRAADVLTDAVMSFQLLQVGGAMIFDDYLWRQNSGDKEESCNLPKAGIDAFLNIFRTKMQIYPNLPLYQLYTQKIAH
jgi:predicted O-methyltransferase YrrM